MLRSYKQDEVKIEFSLKGAIPFREDLSPKAE
jgi:hypothetical protein